MIGSPKLFDSAKIFGAEVIATALLLYFGCMGLMPGLDKSSSLHPLQPAFVWAFVVTSCATIFGPISGAHMNPAVTLSALIHKRISYLTGLVYVVAECTGSFLGCWLVKLTTPCDKYPENFCNVMIHPSLSIPQALLAEFMGTSLLIYVVCSAWDPRSANHMDSMPIKFGFVVAAIIFAVGNYTNASLNPARSLGPAILNNYWKHQWIYWVASLTASVVTTLLYKSIFLKKHQKFVKQNTQTNHEILVLN